ncbi:SUMF1/EgtB/PvdO family nonheme iron enzyme [Candidatus Marithrix sp. Canyon 246]|uniref:SUMF1/EgtB/PvdO family nonheme iron enzyme n=1 Tax=Candidatus Marithrix sp. Canyon 246 TaxID=1827136 RepID=UPI00084A0589|nr:SUMF1/EgtB/PvdO family nonheme iron enzyme [Candidatus Marithrix sp. Canyon 246]
MKNEYIIFILLLINFPALASGDKCTHKLDISCAYNPKSDIEDFILPMPKLSKDKINMVFRKVKVHGSEFWGNPQRLISIGENASKFKGMISGAFYDRKQGNWFYYLGKYEVSIAQYITVMGLKHFYKKCGNKKQIAKIKTAIGKGLLRQLAKPMAWITWSDYQEFIRQYNLWCYSNTECLDKLPRISKTNWKHEINKDVDPPGFFRLPTELEWEYAARGGYEAGSEFEKTLPFVADKIKQYAWAKPYSRNGATRIGRWQASYGFYDLFGNVQELTNSLFVAEIIQGKVGGLTTRGGSYQDQAKTLSSAFRREIELYKAKEDREGKISEITESLSPTTGIRLAIGTLFSPSPRFSEQIETEYKTYTKTFRGQTAAGKSIGETSSGGIWKNMVKRFNLELKKSELKTVAAIEKLTEKAKKRDTALSRELVIEKEENRKLTQALNAKNEALERKNIQNRKDQIRIAELEAKLITLTKTSNPVLIITGAAVLLRQNIRSRKKLARLIIATIVTKLDNSADEKWYQIKTPDGKIGWVAARYTMPVKLRYKAQAYIKVAKRKLNHKTASFGDFVELVNFLKGIIPTIRNRENKAELQFSYLLALQKSLDKLPRRQKNWLKKQKRNIIYDKSSRLWLVKRKWFQQLHDKYSDLAIADRIMLAAP